MTNPSIAVQHVKLEREEPCGVCLAPFIPADDSGSRVILIRIGEDSFTGLLCGGCAMKWTHGRPAAFKHPIVL